MLMRMESDMFIKLLSHSCFEQKSTRMEGVSFLLLFQLR